MLKCKGNSRRIGLAVLATTMVALSPAIVTAAERVVGAVAPSEESWLSAASQALGGIVDQAKGYAPALPGLDGEWLSSASQKVDEAFELAKSYSPSISMPELPALPGLDGEWLSAASQKVGAIVDVAKSYTPSLPAMAPVEPHREAMVGAPFRSRASAIIPAKTYGPSFPAMESPSVDEKGGMDPVLKQSIGCVLTGAGGTGLAILAGGENLVNVISGGLVVPANPIVLYTGLIGVVFASFCAIGQAMTPLYVYYFETPTAPANAQEDRHALYDRRPAPLPSAYPL